MGWLLDLCPPEYRAYDVLRKHPVILARFARHAVGSALAATRTGLATARAELRDVVPPEAVSAAVSAYEREGARLASASRGVGLVEEALRGTRFAAKL